MIPSNVAAIQRTTRMPDPPLDVFGGYTPAICDCQTRSARNRQTTRASVQPLRLRITT
jgi:hypothetical protein